MGGVPIPEQRLVSGRYRLRRLLGQGSMGTVWEAYDELLHRPVAVKEVRLPPGVPAEEADELRERTLREARAIAVVSHPNVITLHDVAREHGEPFVVMEYMPARSLAELLRDGGSLDVPKAALVGYAVAAGLGAAHQAGITHRDVKPGNVLVAEDGRVKLTDFGIARNVSELTITRTGITLGSPAYIAPEVAAGREVTSAADLWGLGATLFAAVEGRAPYDPNGPVLETLSSVVNGEVPAPSPGPLAEVISALMVKDPGARAGTDDVCRMLRPLLPPPGTPLYEADSAEAPTKAERVAVTPPAAVPVPAAEAAGAAEPTGPPPLAADPGPLPFAAPAVVARRRRGRVLTVLVLVIALVLFLGAAGGGFALARMLGGKPVIPPRPTATQPGAAPLGELVDTRGDASTLAGEQGGGFSVPVPQGWQKFVEQRVNTVLPNSTRMHFLSPDGTQQLTVERFPVFYPNHSISDYRRVLQSESPRFEELTRTTVAGTGREPAVELTYRTTETARNTATVTTRITFARLLPAGIDLWVVAVTVPIDQDDTGRTKLFDKIAPEFQVTG
jgi:eukaryotic-like serine/threonine-protein kinase